MSQLPTRRPVIYLGVALALCLPAAAWSAPGSVSKGADEVSKRINAWFAAGEAAGLEGVFYDNRDRKHSNLGIATYPQLKPITYSEAELKARADWGGARRVLPGKVVIGNSSTASPATQAGSHQRMFYVHPRGLQFLYEQYRSNALYVYPEHRDHDPGDNGPDGYGDLYPANSPYLISSQGSSGSDRVFMHALLKTIAAFPPETREVLISKGLLMPTLQAIFRRTYKPAAEAPEGYFTGAAHPSAFEGKGIDVLAMVELAHGMAPDAVPPLAKLRVAAAPAQLAGRDFFEPPGVAGEVLAESPCAVALVFRGATRQRVLRVSAAGSVDAFDRPLRFRWALLRGDPAKVKIEPAGERGEQATITLSHAPRRPISAGSAMWSNRVDIGVFAIAEGSIPSAPAFVSVTTLPNEHRSYGEDGRVLEIFYGARSPALGVPTVDSERWDALLRRFDRTLEPLLESVLEEKVRGALAAAAKATQEDRDELERVGAELADINEGLQLVVDATNKRRVDAAAAHKKRNSPATKTALDAATAKHNVAKKALREGAGGAAELKKQVGELRQKVAGHLREAGTPKVLREEFARLVAEPEFALKFPGQAKVAAGLRGLAAIGVKLSADPSPGERHHLQQLNRDILASVLFPEFLQRPRGPLYADPRLTAPGKGWRDVYQYDANNRRLRGWKRYRDGEVFFFDPGGRLLESRKPVAVRYVYDPRAKRLEWQPER